MTGVLKSEKNPKLQLIPHPRAPQLSDPHQGPLIIQQLIDEISSGKYSTRNQEFTELVRQAGLVSLWFFGRMICGLAGPFDELNASLHVDMCNARQSWLAPGTRALMVIPRGHFKTTICSELGPAWELNRNPNLRIGLRNAISDNATAMQQSIKYIYDSNEAVKWVYPYHCVFEDRDDWNKKVLVMPSRTISYREPSVQSGGVEGTSESKHYDLLIVDDPIGKAALNAMRQSNAVMISAKNWIKGAQSLLQSPKKSRIIVVGTRYSMDDLYEDIINSAYLNLGYPMTAWKPADKGRWIVYYRKAIEDGDIIFPERFDMQFFEDLMSGDIDQWWEWVTQYLNEPYSAGLTDFSSFDLKPCWMDYDERSGELVIRKLRQEEYGIPLSDMDVVQACDPASTERRYATAKTSRSAVGVVATDADWNRYIISLRADYVDTPTMYGWLFENMRKFRRYLRATYLEAQGAYKMLEGIIHDQERQRGEYLKLRPTTAAGDKDTNIKTTLEPELEKGRIYVLEPYMSMVAEEQKLFPQSSRKDILDMLSLAVKSSIKPFSSEEVQAELLNDNWWNERRRNICGV